MNDELDNENFMDVMSVSPVPITRDLVNDLRMEGRVREANLLVKAHLKSIQDNKVQLRKELERNDRRIKSHIFNKEQICYTCKSPLLSSVRMCYFCKRKKSMIDKVARLSKELVNDTGVDVQLVVKALYQENKRNILKYNNKIHKRIMKNNLLVEDK